MAQGFLFAGFVVGLVLLAVVVAFIGRGRREYHVAFVTGERETLGESMRRWSSNPAVLSLGFLALAVGFGGAAVLFIGGAGIPEGMASAAGAFLIGATVLVVVTYLFYGSYNTARSWGLKRSQAVLVGSWVLGALFVVTVSLRLLGLL
ncbi:hypothetical protein ACFQJC_07970 [Haloferax namakaokahaiae]|uniref:Uncharacterized protein n=1 Tax=Haloferax namakaokahaiae TaxID=1748331 RepID=A0ABD5ZDR3_9EURY